MRDRTLPLVLAAALLLLAGTLAAACSSDDANERGPVPTSSGTPLPRSISDYLETLEGILADATDKIGEIETKFESEFADSADAEDADDALDDAIRDYDRTIDRAFLDLSSLRPAAEAITQHTALSAALDRAVTSIDALKEEYETIRFDDDDDDDVSPAHRALAAQTAEAFALISTELEDACLKLQDLAAAHEVEVDLNCGEEAPAPTDSPIPTGSRVPTTSPA